VVETSLIFVQIKIEGDCIESHIVRELLKVARLEAEVVQSIGSESEGNAKQSLTHLPEFDDTRFNPDLREGALAAVAGYR